MQTPILDEQRFLARLRSTPLSPSDVVEAVYRGADPAFTSFVGLSAIWVVVGRQGGNAELAPHSLLVRLPRASLARSAPLTDFHSATPVARLKGDAH